MVNNNSNIRICALKGASDFASKVAEALLEKGASKELLVSMERVAFGNGEGKIEINSGIRQKDVVIMADIGNYSSTYLMRGNEYPMSPEMHFMDIKRTLSAIRNDSRRKIVIMPLLYASRQDIRKKRESLDCAQALQELEQLGVDNIITFDLHNKGVQNAIPNTALDIFYASHLITQQYITDNGGYKDVLVVGPDSGSLERAIYYAEVLQVETGICYKRRDYSKLVDGKYPIIPEEYTYMGANPKDKSILLIDDMICSGGSIWEAIDTLIKYQCKSVSVAATFSFFTEGTDKFDIAYEKGILNKVYTTNLSYIPDEIKQKPWFCEIDCSNYVADIISGLVNNESMETYIDTKSKVFEFKENL